VFSNKAIERITNYLSNKAQDFLEDEMVMAISKKRRHH